MEGYENRIYIVESYAVFSMSTDMEVATINFFNTGDMEIVQKVELLEPAGMVAAIANADDAFNGGDAHYDLNETCEPFYLTPDYRMVKNRIDDAHFEGFWFVNVYERGRAYGGPEEGGWWYTYYLPADHTLWPTTQHNTQKLAQDALHELIMRDEFQRKNSNLVAMVERETPMPKPTYTPHYE